MTSYEMLWDCQYCGTKRLLGVTHRHCPGCGAAQDPTARYFPPPGQEIAVKDHVFVGADWSCPACSTPNGAKAAYCTNCGGAKDGSKSVSLKSDPASAPPPPLPPPAPKAKGGDKRALILGVVGALVAALLFFIFFTKERQLAVQAHAWTRTIQVEELYESREKDECKDMPGGAELRRRFNEERTRKVQDGEECREECRELRKDQGDGSFRMEQSCQTKCTPRYRTEPYTVAMCEFDIGRWRSSRAVKAEGRGLDSAPAWPLLKLKPGSGPKAFGKEREAAKQEVYELTMKDDAGKTFACAVEEQELWAALADGERVSIEFDVLGHPRCGSIKRAARK
jgi:hypothetical protein